MITTGEDVKVATHKIMPLPSYVLITPARNEEAFIDKTIESVVHQTCLPLRWVIVDDGSTDETANIVESYLGRYEWISLLRRPPRKERNFAGKVISFNEGLEHVRNLEFSYVGNLDADISFGHDHFEFLVSKLEQDKTLGVVGTAYTQEDWDSTKDSFEGQASVHGACQLFRNECYRDIGGYVANPSGGVDWIAVTTARMRGWKTRNYPERRFHHYRTMGTAQRTEVGAAFDYGAKDYFLGGSLIWELFRAAYRTTKRPLLVGGIALFGGYCWSAVRRVERPVSRELMNFHRREQMKKLRSILSSLIRLKKLEKYIPAE
jgi:glycosyltransferase involved in cell wall biosynthesis